MPLINQNDAIKLLRLQAMSLPKKVQLVQYQLLPSLPPTPDLNGLIKIYAGLLRGGTEPEGKSYLGHTHSV